MIKFRQAGQESNRKEALAVKPQQGDRIKIIGFSETYIVDAAGLKILKVHDESNPNRKRTVFRKDTVKVFKNE